MKLYCGDCLEMMREIPDKSVDMVLTDPPYGHNNNGGRDLISRRENALGQVREAAPPRPMLNDGKDATDRLEKVLMEVTRILTKNGCCCCCGGGGPEPQFARWSLLLDKYLSFDQMVVWDKGKMGMGWKYRRSYETVLVAHRRGGKLPWYDDTHKVENIIRDIKKIIPTKDQHPTQKPVELMRRFILWHTAPGMTVLDPFMGSGTTGVACVQTGRDFIGMELDEGYFETAKRRIEEAALEGAQT